MARDHISGLNPFARWEIPVSSKNRNNSQNILLTILNMLGMESLEPFGVFDQVPAPTIDPIIVHRLVPPGPITKST